MTDAKHAVRAFIALPLPAPVKDALQAVAAAAGRSLPRGAVRWVKPAAMHLTLRFLGETPADRLADLAAALDETAARHPLLSLQLAEGGCFPNCRRPRVLWVGLQPAAGSAGDGLLDLQADIECALGRLGWEPEGKRFRPHLTVGRIKNPAAVAGFAWRADVPAVRWTADGVQLIESELLPDGPRYTVRHTAALTASRPA